MNRLILASASPRRRELLSLFGIPFEVIEADIDETPLDDEDAAQMTRRLAAAKAEAVLARIDPGHVVLGGDTTVCVENQILGKPADRNEAITMLERLSGNNHQVLSAVALAGCGDTRVRLCTTWVRFCTLSSAEITRYCDSGEPFDKAGAYGIQGLAGSYVEEITGSHSGVVGLPLRETRLLLESANIGLGSES